MAEQKPIPVRLSDDLITRLDDAASNIGSTRAALIRLCTQTFLEHLEKRGFGALPVDWQKIIADADGRRSTTVRHATSPKVTYSESSRQSMTQRVAETPVQYGAKGKKKPGNSSTE